MIRVSNAQRRARLVARHHLACDALDAPAAIRGVVAMHASDPATPYLAARARVPGFQTADLDDALLRDRTLWRLHAMRRTLFVVPTVLAPVILHAASQDIARKERRRVEGWLSGEMNASSVAGYLAGLESDILEALSQHGALRTKELTALIPGLALQITLGSGKWSTRSSLSSRLLFLMAMEARITRAGVVGSWRSSQYRWAEVQDWFGSTHETLEPARARAQLARLYLAAYGPATMRDLRWWTGWTAKQAAAAVESLSVLPARLDDGDEAVLLPDDAEPGDPDPGDPTPHPTLLPALDPTPMGWKDRSWFLGQHEPALFDRNGNIGPSLWVDGRIVGGWAQRPDGQVVYRVLEDIGTEAEQRIEGAAAALTAFLAGDVVVPRFRTPLERDISG